MGIVFHVFPALLTVGDDGKLLAAVCFSSTNCLTMSDLDHTKVREALELVDYSVGTEGTHVGDARDRRLDMLMQYFINEFPASGKDLRVSNSLIQSEIQDILSYSARSDSPIEEFMSRFDELPAVIGQIDLEDFQLGFPLNISDWPLGTEIAYQNYIFNNIEWSKWKVKYADPARDDPDFVDQFGERPNEFDEEFTYWEIEYTARDPEYAIELVERELEVILGQIIYSMLPWSHSNQFHKGDVWNRPWSELRPPFVYLVRDKNGYHDYYFDDDISPREAIQMLLDRKERVEFRYPQIPSLESSNRIERKLITAFRNFHSGATEPNRRRAFLDYWRAIETLCLFGDEKMEDIVPRIKSVVRNDSSDSLFEERVKEIKNKRNEYVHEQVDVRVTERDNEFLRQLFYELVPFFVINRNTDVDRILIWLDNGYKSSEKLDHELQSKENELHLLRKIRNTKQR